MHKLLAALLTLLAVLPGTVRAAPGEVRVRLETTAGPITVAVDTRSVPKTAANFLAYVDDGRFDGTFFYRAQRNKAGTGGFIQGGISTDARRSLRPIAHEPTTRTGLRHVAGTLSMARRLPGSATGNFTIAVSPLPSMDARGNNPGYAAFGRVVSGMDVVRRIHGLPTGGGREAMRGQMILKPVKIVRAVRLDGKAKPTGRPRPWLLFQQRR